LLKISSQADAVSTYQHQLSFVSLVPVVWKVRESKERSKLSTGEYFLKILNAVFRIPES
jgi:hypothetical protein